MMRLNDRIYNIQILNDIQKRKSNLITGQPGRGSTMPSTQSSRRKPVAKHLRKQDGAQSVRRTIKILRYVAMYNERGVRLSKVARGTDLHVTTVSRILSVLVEEGFVTHSPNTKLYNLGFEFHSLAKSTEFSRLTTAKVTSEFSSVLTKQP